MGDFNVDFIKSDIKNDLIVLDFVLLDMNHSELHEIHM